MPKINIPLIILLGLIMLFLMVVFNTPLESQQLFSELIKILISGYLGYMVRTVTSGG